jgi:predicted flap endonuclease-1-like 5' DNA nuclease
MNVILAEYWGLVILALIAGIAIAWWIFAANRRTGLDTRAGDVLDEGAQKANRNQALIDAPAATVLGAISTPATGGLAGAGGVVAAGAAQEAARNAELPDAPAEEPAAETASPEPAAQPAAAPHGETDDLTKIKGVGSRIAQKLNGSGITTYQQIAQWSDADIAHFNDILAFNGRIERDRWVEQARYLAAGDMAEYEARFGRA